MAKQDQSVEDAGPPRTSSRMLVALLFFGTILNYVDRQVLSLLKPTIQAAYGWTDTDFAHFASASQAAAAIALIFVGWLIDRFGVRAAYGAAVAVWSIAGMAHAFAANVGQFIAARVVLVSAEAANTPAAVKAAAQFLTLEERSPAIGIVNTAPNLGNILAPLLVIPFAAMFGWQATFLVTGALGFAWLAWWIASTRKLVPCAGSQTESKPQIGAALGARTTWAIAGAKAITDMFWWFFTFWLPDLFHKAFNLSQAGLAGPTALAFVLAAAGALTGGWLFPRLLRATSDLNRARKVSMLVFALCVIPVPVALHMPNAWAAAAIIGLGLFAHQGFSTNIFGFAADAVPAARVATVMAIGAIAGNLAGVGIQEATGRLLSSGAGYEPLLYAAAAAYLIALGWIQLWVPKITAANDR